MNREKKDFIDISKNLVERNALISVKNNEVNITTEDYFISIPVDVFMENDDICFENISQVRIFHNANCDDFASISKAQIYTINHLGSDGIEIVMEKQCDDEMKRYFNLRITSDGNALVSGEY